MSQLPVPARRPNTLWPRCSWRWPGAAGCGWSVSGILIEHPRQQNADTDRYPVHVRIPAPAPARRALVVALHRHHFRQRCRHARDLGAGLQLASLPAMRSAGGYRRRLGPNGPLRCDRQYQPDWEWHGWGRSGRHHPIAGFVPLACAYASSIASDLRHALRRSQLPPRPSLSAVAGRSRNGRCSPRSKVMRTRR